MVLYVLTLLFTASRGIITPLLTWDGVQPLIGQPYVNPVVTAGTRGGDWRFDESGNAVFGVTEWQYFRVAAPGN